jgi:5-methylcytosine-specific restriction endonuclease McrA
LVGGLAPFCFDCSKIKYDKLCEDAKNTAALIPENYTKECNRCYDEKPRTQFSFNKGMRDGLMTICKDCYKEIQKEIKALNQERRKNGYFKSDISFECCDCRITKHISFFNKNDNSIRGVLYFCRDCAKQRRIDSKDDRKAYVQKNSLKMNAQASAKRLHMSQYDTISQKALEELLERYENKCSYCGIEVRQRDNLHMDHIIPLKLGGPHTIENLAPACKTCNLEKGSMTKEEFLEKRRLRELYGTPRL